MLSYQIQDYLDIIVSSADVVADNFNSIETLLVNGSIKFFIKDKIVFSNGPKGLPRNRPNCTILDS